jgi:DNA-binding NarL/FixJ family response regulator
MPAVHPTPPIRILVLLSTPLLACGIGAVLGGDPRLRVEQGLPARTAPRGHDVLIADLAGGLALLAASPGARVLVISASCREREVHGALQRGVLGYLMSDCSPDELRAAVLRVAAGGRAICAAAAECLATSLSSAALTSRELQVLALLARGWQNKAIARELCMAVGTVKAHMKMLLAKLGAGSRTEVVSIALQRGLLAPVVPAPAAIAPAAPPRGLEALSEPPATAPR